MPPRRDPARGVTWSAFRRLALERPGVVPATSYGRPALRGRRRLMARLEENAQDVAIRMDFADRDILLEADPDAFYLTDRYRRYPALVVRLKQLRRDMLARLIEESWRAVESGAERSGSRRPSRARPAKSTRRGSRRERGSP